MYLNKVMEKYVEKCVERQWESIVPSSTITRVQTCIAIVTDMLDRISDGNRTPEVIESIVSFSCVWAFGGGLVDQKTSKERSSFEEFWRQEIKPAWLQKDTSVFDYNYNLENLTFGPWNEIMEEFIPQPIGSGPGDVEFRDVFVPHLDAVRLMHVLGMLSRQAMPTMLAGNAGTGKTALMRLFLGAEQPDEMMFATINMNYYMEHADLQREIEFPIDKRSGHVFGPPAGRKLTYFIDDLNLPFVEVYGTQNSHSMLRMALDVASFYDRSDLSVRKEIADTQFVAAMNPTAGSFVVAPRLQRHFALLAVEMVSASEATRMFDSIVDSHLSRFSVEDIRSMSKPIVGATVDLLAKISDLFLPSAIKFMYNWNMRELVSVIEGITRTDSDSHNTLH